MGSVENSKDKQSAKQSMKTIVQANIYRLQDGRTEFLLLKRNDADKFWQPVSEEHTDDNTLAETLQHVLSDQLGIEKLKRISPEIYTYEWYSDGEQGRDIVFAGEVDIGASVVASTNRYKDSAWFSYSDAIQHLKWDGNKQALRRLSERIAREPRPPAATKNKAPEANKNDAKPTPAAETISPPTPKPEYYQEPIPVLDPFAASLYDPYTPQPQQQQFIPPNVLQDVPQYAPIGVDSYAPPLPQPTVIPIPVYRGPNAQPPPPPNAGPYQ